MATWRLVENFGFRLLGSIVLVRCMNSPQWADVGGGHRAPTQTFRRRPFRILVHAFQGRDFAALDRHAAVSDCPRKQAFLDVCNGVFSEEVLKSLGPALVSAVNEFDACTGVEFPDYLFLEGLRILLLRLGLLNEGSNNILTDKLKWRLEATQGPYQAKIEEESCARAEAKAEERRLKNIQGWKAKADEDGEELLIVTEFWQPESGASSNALWLTAEQRSLIAALQVSNPYSSSTNWPALTKDSGLSALQLKSLAASYVTSETRVVSFRRPGVQPTTWPEFGREVSAEAYVTPPQSPQRSE